MTDGGIKSKERVVEFGEVFTPKDIVNDMLDLVAEESYRIDATFLEPACGNGNFLVEILRRKLETAKNDLENFERNVFIALSSTYGIDIQLDNVEESKARMLGVVKEAYKNIKREPSENILKTCVYIMDRNIIWGDALTEKFMGDIHTGEEYIIHKELKVTEWEITDSHIKMTEQSLAEDDREYEQLEITEFLVNESITEVVNLMNVPEYVTDERLDKLCKIHEDYEEEMKKLRVTKQKDTEAKKNGASTKKKRSKVITAW